MAALCHLLLQGLTDVRALPTELRILSHLEAKVTADGHPIILSANLTRGLGRKISLAAMLKNVFRETASLSGIKRAKAESFPWECIPVACHCWYYGIWFC